MFLKSPLTKIQLPIFAFKQYFQEEIRMGDEEILHKFQFICKLNDVFFTIKSIYELTNGK